MADVTITGLDELEAKLAALPAKLAKRVVRPALEEGAAIIQQEMGILAPRRAEGGGFLTTHIGVSVVLSGKEDEGLAKIAPTSQAYYGLMQELGFHVGGTEVPPQPFMRPAFENKKNEALKAITDEIRRGLKEVAE
jgi:HK97 gp10 family phage protein